MKIIGHRANDLKTIEKYLLSGVDEIEVDVRVNERDEAVLSHDEEIATSAPKLSAAIKTVNRKCPIIIEIKPREQVTPVVNIVDNFLAKGWKPTQFSIASFDPDVLVEARKLLPDVSLILLEKWSGLRARIRADRVGTKNIAMNQRWLWSGFIRAVSREGFKLSAYTLNNPAKARKWQKAGLVGVITDYPDRFKK